MSSGGEYTQNVMDETLLVQEGLVIPHWEVVFTTSKSSGPGGQHANKTNSRVTLHWSLDASSAFSDYQKHRIRQRLGGRINSEGVLLIHVEESRQQSRNKEIACQRLVEMLRDALKQVKRRRPTKRTKSSQRRRVNEKRARGDIKELRRKPDRGSD